MRSESEVTAVYENHRSSVSPHNRSAPVLHLWQQQQQNFEYWLFSLTRPSAIRLSALSVFREMQSDGVDPDRDSYFFVMSACSKRGEAKTALALLAEMKARRQQQQQQRAGGGAGGSGEEEDEDGALAPDLLLYAVVMKACAWGKRWQQAVRLLDDMSAAGGECGNRGHL